MKIARFVSKVHLALGAALFAIVTSGPAHAESRTLKKIAETGVINMGVRDNSVPFSYLNDDQTAIGYSVDICMQVVEALKRHLQRDDLQVKTVAATPATRIVLIGNGTIDIECSTGTNTAARQQQVSFSNSIFVPLNTFASKKERGISTIADLKGRTVASTAGSSNLVYLNELNTNKNLGMRIVPVKDMAEGMLMLSTDRIDAMVSDDALLASSIANTRNPEDYMISKDVISPPEPYGIIMPKEDPEFKAVVDKAVADFFASPAAYKNYERWFMQPIPPRNLVVNFAMNPATRSAYERPTDSIKPGTYK